MTLKQLANDRRLNFTKAGDTAVVGAVGDCDDGLGGLKGEPDNRS